MKLNNAYTKVIYKRYPNMNYLAEKLAVIFGYTVSDIMDINKEILFEQVRTQCPFNQGEIVTQFFANLKTKDFGSWVKLNRNFWMKAKRELEEKHKKAEEAHDKAFDEYQKVYFVYLGPRFFINQFTWDDEYDACNKADEAFTDQIEIEEALLRCGFVTQASDWEKWTQITYNIKIYDEGLISVDEWKMDIKYSDDEE
jgi:hypothetical protein